MTHPNPRPAPTAIDETALRVREAIDRGRARMNSTWFNEERFVAALMLAFSCYLLILSLGLGVFDHQQAAPGTFPAVVSLALVVLSAIWLLTARGPAPDPAGPGDQVVETIEHAGPAVIATEAEIIDVEAEAEAEFDPDEALEQSETHPWRLWFVVAWSALVLSFVDLVGMMPVLLVYVAGLLIVVARVKWWKAILFPAIVIFAAAYGAYQGGIYVPDPFRIGEAIARFLNSMFG